jgi:hypothetical protein
MIQNYHFIRTIWYRIILIINIDEKTTNDIWKRYIGIKSNKLYWKIKVLIQKKSWNQISKHIQINYYVESKWSYFVIKEIITWSLPLVLP